MSNYVERLINEINSPNKNISMIKGLITNIKQKKININDFGKTKRAPIHHAVQKGDIEILDLLIANGADVNLPTNDNLEDTPLHIAIIYSQNRALQTLLKKGANPNRKNKTGVSFNNKEDKTPLHQAIQKQNLAAIFLLLSYGASLRIKNQNDENAIEQAKTKFQYQQMQEQRNSSGKKNIKHKTPISRARKAFYLLCGIVLFLSTFTIGAGFLLFYTYIAAPYAIIWAAGGFGVVVTLALLGISTAFKSSTPIASQQETSPVLTMLEEYREQTHIRIAYYTVNSLLGLASAGVLGAGIAMYFNVISLPFIPFVAVGGAGILLATILMVSFAVYKRWSENRIAENLIQEAETAKPVTGSSHEKMIASRNNKTSQRASLLTANSCSNPDANRIDKSNYRQHRIAGIESSKQQAETGAAETLSGFTVPGPGFFVSPDMIRASITRESAATNPGLVGSFSFDQQVDDIGNKLDAPDKSATQMNSDPNNLSISTPYTKPTPKSSWWPIS